MENSRDSEGSKMTTLTPIFESRPPEPKNEQLMKTAQKLEANFLAEMFKATGIGEARQSFGGGVGEDQFSSFLVREYADAAVQAGGIGLSESIYNTLVKREAST